MASESPLRIYADFNGVVASPRNPERGAVVLDTFGSLRDLANAGVVLGVDMPLVGVDASDEVEDLEGHGTAQYDAKRQRWVIEFDDAGIRYVPAGDRSQDRQLRCVQCRQTLIDAPSSWTGAMIGPGNLIAPEACCPNCGTRVLAPLAPPAP